MINMTSPIGIIKNLIADLPVEIQNSLLALKNPIEMIQTIIEGIPQDIKDSISEIKSPLDIIKVILSAIPEDIANQFSNINLGIEQKIQDIKNSIPQSIQDIFQNTINQVSGIFGMIQEVKSAIESVKTFDYTKAMEDIKNAIIQLPTTVIDSITLVYDLVVELPQAIYEVIVKSVKDAWIPSDVYLEELALEVNDRMEEKLYFAVDVYNFFKDIKNVSFEGYEDSPPEFNVVLPQSYGGKEVSIIDFQYYHQYRSYIHTFMTFAMWFMFLKRVYKRMPQFIYK